MNVVFIRAQTEEEIQKCYQVRIDVFVNEQKFPLEIEIDELDPIAYHWLAYVDPEQPLGTVRVVRLSPDVVKVSRLAVKSSARGLGIGKKLMLALEGYCSQELAAKRIKIHSQWDKQAFYEKLGYIHDASVPPFDEDGMQHVLMYKDI